jgi:hypothetical protein
MTVTDNANYVRWTTLLLAAWFAFSIIASALRLFRAGSPYAVHPPLPLGLAVAVPVLAFLMWFASSPRFREFVLSLDARTLTVVQSWRIGGFVFLVLYAHGLLPGTFALPAGWGDIAVGSTAWLAARHLTRDAGRKNGFIAWQLLGVADLLMAVSLGVLSSPTPMGLLRPEISTDIMTTLPLSLIPTFVVPLLLIFHIICIAQATRWAVRPQQGIAPQSLPGSAG